jgi:Ca-activated chloride channel family protein
LLFPLLLLCLELVGQAGYRSASFSMGKQNAQLLRIPQPEEVVIDEYLNYHRHRLPLPTHENVAMNLAWTSSDLFGLSGAARPVLQIGLTTLDALKTAARPRANISLVIDVSGSMSGEKMEKTRLAMQTLSESLRGDDVVSIVLFNGSARVHVPAQPVGNGRALLQAIEQIQAGGSTNIGAGVMMGCQELLKNYQPELANRIILLTDARANTGEVAPRRILAQIQGGDPSDFEGVDFAFIGVGMDFDHHFARTFAENGRNSLHFIHDAEDIRKVFQEEAQSLLAPAAREVSLSIRVEGYSSTPLVYGLGDYAQLVAGRARTFKLDDMNFGLTQVILLEFPEAGQQPQVAVELQYADPYREERVRRSLLSRSTQANFSGAEAREVERNWAIARMATAMKEMARSYHGGEETERAAARQPIEAALQAVEAQPWLLRDPDVKRVMDILRAYRKDLLELAERG